MARHFTIPGVSDVYVGKEGEKRLIMDPYVRLNLPVCLTKWLAVLFILCTTARRIQYSIYLQAIYVTVRHNYKLIIEDEGYYDIAC